MDRLKISDGDLILITLGGDSLTSNNMLVVREHFHKWIKERGLEGCRLLVLSGLNASGVDIKVLSVNNIFEDTVLKDDV